MRKFLVLLLFVCYASAAFCQDNLPPVFEIKADTIEYVRLNNSSWQVLKDKTEKLTIDQVSKPPLANQFYHDTVAVKGVNVYWFRYRIKNAMAQQVEITIQELTPAYADLYARKVTGELVHKKTGYAVPWSQRDGLKAIREIIYTIEPGEELLIYERDKFNFYLNSVQNFEVDIGVAKNVIQKEYVDNSSSALPSFVFGVFLIAAFLNIYFFLIVRERVYLYLSLAIAFNGLGRFLYNTDIFFHGHPLAGMYVMLSAFLFYFFFLIHFVRYFLETFKYAPRWDKILIGLSICTSAIFILGMSNTIITTYIGNRFLGLVFSFILVTFMLFLNSPDRSVRIRTISVLPAIVLLWVLSASIYVSMLNKYTGVTIRAIVNWLGTYFDLLEQIGIAWLILFFSISLFRRYQQLQKQIAFEAIEKERLARQKEIERSQLIEQQKITLEQTVEERTAELKHSLDELKSTQAQLIQSEKMASLGELTAGIAHEIQNPLNFVNNFSEVNKELIQELREERNKEQGTRNEDRENEILNNIEENEEKINHHGRRADAIVKGMLQHSRTSSGQKEITDVNALCDEYLRLAYHGLRAKDKSFNAKIETNFDNSIGKINVVPQDIGRVMLNLINNAFYAASQPSEGGLSNSDGRRVPTVWVSTKKLGDRIIISVKDNGDGISDSIKEKIFQPFFTTKPTGQGTGLGLSLAYDIAKAHDGDIKVETKAGNGSEFIVELPTTTHFS